MGMIDEIEAILQKELEDPCEVCRFYKDEKCETDVIKCPMDFKHDIFKEIAEKITQEMED